MNRKFIYNPCATASSFVALTSANFCNTSVIGAFNSDRMVKQKPELCYELALGCTSNNKKLNIH